MSCNNKKRDFYSYSRDFDLCRIPLIAPIEINSSGGGVKGTWLLENVGENIDKIKTIPVDSVGLLKGDSVYAIYNKRLYLPTKGGMYESWIVFKNNEILKILNSYTEYKAYCMNKFKQEIKLFEPSIIFIDFEKNDFILNWQ